MEILTASRHLLVSCIEAGGLALLGSLLVVTLWSLATRGRGF